MGVGGECGGVSTHSRPKAAGPRPIVVWMTTTSFNTQPPEGGWAETHRCMDDYNKFQHTAARRRLGSAFLSCSRNRLFQHTAARRRLGN